MQPSFLNFLACPDCTSCELRLRVAKERESILGHTEIEKGSLVCAKCGESYAIEEGIPRMLPRDLREPSTGKECDQAERTLRTAVGYDIHHLKRYSKISQGVGVLFGHAADLGLARQYFRDYLDLGVNDLQSLKGRVVLDAGCGGGRFMAVARGNGAAVVVGLDMSVGGLLHARALLNRTEGCHLVQGDITRPPFRPGIFQIAYSIGVIHLLPAPQEGFRALERLLSPGGRLWIWAYGLEGMSLAYRLSHLVWLRRLTCAWPLEAKFHLCRWLALAFRSFYLYPLRLAQLLLPDAVSCHLPFTNLTGANYDDIMYAFFDRLQPPHVHYLRKADLQGWLARLQGVSVEAPKKRGWVVKGQKATL